MIKVSLNTLIKVCSIFIIVSCSNNVDKNTNQKKADYTITSKAQLKEESVARSVNENAISKLSVEKIDLSSIKKKYVNSYTSGTYSKKESENYLSKEQSAFYGVYFFVSPDSQIPFIGKAIVACQEQDGWDYFNEQEELVEFSAFSNQLNPFIETVRIGQNKKDVVKELGDNFKKADNNLIYSDEAGNVVSILINIDTVQAIKVGRYEEVQKVRPINLKW